MERRPPSESKYLTGQGVALTGRMTSMTRAEAAELIALHAGLCRTREMPRPVTPVLSCGRSRTGAAPRIPWAAVPVGGKPVQIRCEDRCIAIDDRVRLAGEEQVAAGRSGQPVGVAVRVAPLPVEEIVAVEHLLDGSAAPRDC